MDSKEKISLFTIIDIIILAIGVWMSISSTMKTFQYTAKYAWCFVFALLGIAMIAFLIWKIRKKRIWLIGIGLIIVYLVVGGFGAFVCEYNYTRLKRLSWYDGKEVNAEVDGVCYTWDNESVTYDPTDMEYVGYPSDGESIKITVDGKAENHGVYTKSSTDYIYVEIYSGGTGIYLILDKK
jgi:hypothetical protein